MSLLISFLLWYFTRNWRKERKARKLEKQIEKYGYEGAELRRKDKILFDNYMHKVKKSLKYCFNGNFKNGFIKSAIVVFILLKFKF